METPDLVFSDWICPPLKTVTRSVRYSNINDPGKRTVIPVVNDAYFDNVFNLNSLVLKYPLTPSYKGTILRPLSTCLPFGAPNRVANLQDLCSGVLPLAINAQTWLRLNGNRPARKKKDSKNEQIEYNGESPDDDEIVFETRTRSRKNSLEIQSEVKTSLSFGEIDHLPNHLTFRPPNSDKEKIKAVGKRATVYSGFGAMLPLNSSLNWWYSGGTLKYLPLEHDHGILLSPGGALSTLEVTPILITDKFHRRIREKPGKYSQFIGAPIYQIDVQKIESFERLIHVRTPTECQIFGLSEEEEWSLSKKLTYSVGASDYFTHISASSYIPGEFLSASQQGIVTLWNTERNGPVGQIDIEKLNMKSGVKYGWTGCYFGNFPRSICILTPSAVDVFDGRLHQQSKSQIRLLQKSDYIQGVGDSIVAGCGIPGHACYHAVLTTKELLIVDQRFPIAPVEKHSVQPVDLNLGVQPLRYPSQSPSPPLYLKITKDVVSSTSIVLTGSQISQAVMCHQIDLSCDSKPATYGSLPFFAASPKNLIPLALSADIRIPVPTKVRLGRPIIGIEGIPHADGGFTVASVTALGDVFMQSFDVVQEKGYEPDGTDCFSAVDTNVRLSKKEKKYVEKWMTEAGQEVVDPTRRNFLQPFIPEVNGQIAADMEKMYETIACAVLTAPHADCERCKSVKQLNTPVSRASSTKCNRCRMDVNGEKGRKSTSSNPFCFIEEKNSSESSPLVDAADHEQRLIEMGRTNRIVWKILKFGYGLDIPSDELVPKSEEMPPPVNKKLRRKTADAQQEKIQALLESAKKMDNNVSEQESGNLNDIIADLPDSFEQMMPLATSTQKSKLDDEPQQELPEEMTTLPELTKSAKAKRRSGF